ncbi:2'-5' RNA ligase family protein [Pontixanthobacter rizhaonensis]|uniref:2'-5' RNA ligase family protein n=1 Tax=Pontixanthobacter rizhaonensis TaxID=2730337 RepID=UPI0031B5BCCF
MVTAQLPPDLASWATKLRTAHFPPERNFLDAHVTLFHSLPPSSEREVKTALARQAAAHPPVEAYLEGIMPLGKGTALDLHSPGMISIWEDLADSFFGLLIPQDEHAPRLHVTVQNKVTIEEAKALQQELLPVVEPRPFRFIGLSLYIYRGGPWEFVRTYPFRGR